MGLPEGARPDVAFTKGDMFEELANKPDLLCRDDVTVCLANSVCFDGEMMTKLAELVKSLPDNAYLISFTRMLPDVETWTLLSCESIQVPWGTATCFLHQKIPPPPEDDEMESPVGV